MVAGWHRVGAGLGLALAALVLSGCHVQGTFDVLSEDRVGLDFVVSGDDAQCANAAYVLKLSAANVEGANGEPACRIFGQTQATYFSPFGIQVSNAAEYLVLQTSLAPGADDWPAPDLHIRFPGQVVTASRGVVAGDEVRINDLALLGEGAGLRVVALARPGPPAWVLAATVGTGSGIVATLAILALVRFSRRPRRTDPALLTLQLAELPTDADEAGAQAGGNAVAGPHPDAGSNGHRDAAGLSPQGADPPQPVGEGPGDSRFAPPPPDAPELYGPTAPQDTTATAAPFPPGFADGPQAASWADEAPDHSVWAPPEDRS